MTKKVSEELIKYWNESLESGDLKIIAFKLGLKSTAPVCQRLKGNCGKGDAIIITRFFKDRERKLKRQINK